ncbi:bifunctional MaoC family dehydratase N-terminal/OB-fold nucleic acid binding domain-containing protein [Williamsia soli]|uniref:bifunctional MaoC family dehydratase N-terminal/OB-fold nucleic acid binding domain-containing protein n=1 Tax=Williamsia soli TaxID=364929 RepID=UPI001A9D6D83|nr:OB-fold domain-containing protein [Williamsia soli]
MSDGRAAILAATDEVRAAGTSAPQAGRDPINTPMINNWVEAIGDTNPIYVDPDAARSAGYDDVVAPPAMAQVWTMRGLNGVRAADDPLGQVTEILDAAGYSSVVATNCDSTYHRYTTPGEEVTIEAALTDVVGPKQTALGEGWFFTTKNIWKVGDEVVAEMDFRILKFRPTEKAAKPDSSGGEVISSLGVATDDVDPTKMMRPTPSLDTLFFWDGVREHELRIQQVEDGSLRHPPVPALWKPKGESTDYVVSSGRGTVYSYVVHHAPQVPGRTLPFVIALVELDEGVRLLGELRGIDPAQVIVGLPVQVEFLDFPADGSARTEAWTLYSWQPAGELS